ncbi:MAG: flagellar hook-basal body complex protein FliE [Candidatus Hydrogenedentota bacterium]|nr:MAG: flagellar hook-basal body complex protein FliE [Candidatus Hydrogenedentota bacterium]
MIETKLDLFDLVPKAETFRKTSRRVRSVASAPPKPGAELVQEFGKILGEKLESLIDVTQTSERMARDFAAGKVENLHEVMIAGAKADLAIETAVQVRNLAVRAYQNLTTMR